MDVKGIIPKTEEVRLLVPGYGWLSSAAHSSWKWHAFASNRERERSNEELHLMAGLNFPDE
jgi:hypothetical protein